MSEKQVLHRIHRMKMRVAFLLNLAFLLKSLAADVRVCPAVAREMYELYPVVNTYECMNQGDLDKGDRAACDVGVLRPVCLLTKDKAINDRADRCRALQTRLSDQSMGINALVPASHTDAVEVKGVEIDKFAYASLDFVPLNTRLVKWRSVALEIRAPLPKALGGTLSFSSAKKTFVNGASGVAIVGGLTINKDFRNDAIVMDGCALPTFDFRVAWQYTGACWARTITVTVSSTTGICVQRFSSNYVRTHGTKAAALSFIQSQDWAESGVKFPREYAELIFKCAQDGKWSGQTSNAPGSCATCASVTAKQDGLVVVSCNRTLPQQPDCCVGCNPTTHMALPGAAALKCVSKCAPGYALGALARCSPCPFGQTSNGGLSQCLTCAAMLGNRNSAYVLNACVACGPLAYASGTTCEKCPSGKHVRDGNAQCETCARQGHFVSAIGTCTPCAPGTYFSAASGGCLICPSNTFAPNNGSTACTECAIGHVSSLFTSCVPCPIINASAMPFAQYYQRGCNIRCAPNVSYVRTSPYVRDGCASCAAVVAPVGTFISSKDCTITRPCTPRLNAYYISNGTGGDNCRWKCNVGFQPTQGGTCVKCNFDTQYNPARHVAVEDCKYTCRPGLYTPNCNISCVNLLSEASAGRIKPRVREYANMSRPDYAHGMCGTDEALPRSNVIFLRFGRWAYISKPKCGNSLLNANEDCDDGNAVSGDGCSSTCRVESSTTHKWECDLIGAPCVRNCGWTFKSPTPNGVGLIGFYLPPDATDCMNLSYRYNVEPLSPFERAEWMKNNLRRCDECGPRTLPFSECNSTNRGCRECGSGQYHDNAAGKCVMCGSACPPGYSGTTCSDVLQQGCAPCEPRLGTRYIQGCERACVSDAAPEHQTYCSTMPDNVTGVCKTSCLYCAVKLNALRYGGNTPSVGYYPMGCRDAVGYKWEPCDTASRPIGSIWTSNSISDRSGCSWACAAGYYPWRGTCVPTFQVKPGEQASCLGGQRIHWTADDKAVCLPCVGALPGAYQIWTSVPPYFSECVPACSPSVSYRLTPNATDCAPCSNPQCALGEYLDPCTVTTDAACLPCGALQSRMEYVSSGCKTRCIAGYFAGSQGCVSCDLLPSCPPGSYRPAAGPCDAGCTECPAAAPNTVWHEACDTTCAPGFIIFSSNSTGCQLCDPSAMCQHGGECTLDSVVCYDAPAAAAETTESAPAARSAERTIIMGGVARPDLKYPTRRNGL